MNLLDYLRVVIRRGWIIVLAVAITASSAFIFSKLQTPVYRATQRVSVQPARNDFGLAETLRILLRSYVIILNTDENAQEVINRLQLDMLPGQLRAATTIDSDPTILIVQIDVDLEDPDMAAAIAYQWGVILQEWRDQQNEDLQRQDRIEASLLDYPQAYLYRPNTMINVLAAAVLGLVIGGVVIFVLEYMESNVLRRTEDIERWIDTPVLAAITSETRGS